MYVTLQSKLNVILQTVIYYNTIIVLLFYVYKWPIITLLHYSQVILLNSIKVRN